MDGTQDRRKRKRWKLRQLEECIETATDVLGRLTATDLRDLIRRYEEAVGGDGYPAGGESNGGKSADVTTSTERAALHGLPEQKYDEFGVKLLDNWTRHDMADPVGDAVFDLFRLLELVARASRRIEKNRDVVIHAGSRLEGRGESTIGFCQACGRDVARTTADPISSGFCTRDPGCYSSWRRWKEANGTGDVGLDRKHFIAWRREQLVVDEPKAAS